MRRNVEPPRYSNRRSMRSLLVVILIAFTAGTATASEQSDVMAPVHLFVNAFNRGDARTALTACANPVSVIDEFPPYAWTGPAGCSDWAAAFDVNAKRKSITDAVVTIVEPTHITIVRNRAYVVTHATYAWKEHGKAMSETAARLTIALHRTGGVWVMTAWTWSNG
jgi:hypothetical protein